MLVDKQRRTFVGKDDCRAGEVIATLSQDILCDILQECFHLTDSI